MSRFTSAIHNNELKSADMEGILIMLLSFAASRQSDVSYFMSKLGDRLNNTSSVTSAGLAATSTMLQCSLVPNNQHGAFLADVWRSCFRALQSESTY